MSRILIAIAIVLSLIGIGALGTQIGTTSLTFPQPIGVETALAAKTDSCSGSGYMLWAPQVSGNQILYRGGAGCSLSWFYKFTLYQCDDVCTAPRVNASDVYRSSYLFPTQYCTITQSGPYWSYVGVKVEARTVQGTWGDARWFWGPGAWIQGSC